MSLLEVRGVSKRFGSLAAVREVSLAVEAGELRAIIGPNGAGKTTFFNLISGLFAPTTGSILFAGQDISLTGTLLGGLLIGVASGITAVFLPAASEAIMYVLMAVVLLLRPRGLLGEEGMLT